MPLVAADRDPAPPTPPLVLKRVTALIGPYGSGKSELALLLAEQAAQELAAQPPQERRYQRVQLADLDVLKPYFRSREAGLAMLAQGVGILAPPAALAASDLPILTAEMRAAIGEPMTRLIMDVGGDPTGAKALGSMSDAMSAAPHDLLLVLNRNRPFMNSVERVAETARRIGAAANLALTGLVSNTHYLDHTNLADIRGGIAFSQRVAEQLRIPLVLVGVSEALLPQMHGLTGLPPLVVVRRHLQPAFMGGVVLGQGPINLPLSVPLNHPAAAPKAQLSP
jgi:hypothetical protein